MDLKLIGLTALVNAALTIVLSIIFFPLLVLGPLIGGFLASYLSKGFEDYDKMDEKDGMVVGAISGLIGGLIIGLLSILGIGNISNVIEVMAINNIFISSFIILQLSLIISFILGLVGGVVGILMKK
ncbi:MAG: DUF5518 domain-containing protein [Methanobacterium sp.]|uniref:DUF5518 domain-containing protein n=1 Tax=Methanobacterium sp. TaxID=2164 RepID=UPI003D64745D|nr:DUF5518 domain-containing protein [Methanobacterium sp.]